MGILGLFVQLFVIFIIIAVFGTFFLSLIVDVALALPSAIVFAIFAVLIYHFFFRKSRK
jgi:hypothetical protein